MSRRFRASESEARYRPRRTHPDRFDVSYHLPFPRRQPSPIPSRRPPSCRKSAHPCRRAPSAIRIRGARCGNARSRKVASSTRPDTACRRGHPRCSADRSLAVRRRGDNPNDRARTPRRGPPARVRAGIRRRFPHATPCRVTLVATTMEVLFRTTWSPFRRTPAARFLQARKARPEAGAGCQLPGPSRPRLRSRA